MLAYKYFLVNAFKYLTAFVTKPSPSLSINLSKKTFGLEGFFPHQQNKRVGVLFLQQNKNKRVCFLPEKPLGPTWFPHKLLKRQSTLLSNRFDDDDDNARFPHQLLK